MRKKTCRKLVAFSAIIGLSAASALEAADIVLPATAELIDREVREGSIALPIGRYSVVARPSVSTTGQIARQSWVIPGTDNAEALIRQLQDQYERQGFAETWQCQTDSCGGFDFRYGIETSPPPVFDINLEEFHYVDLRNEDGEIITLLSSPLNGNIYLQQIYVTADDEGEAFNFVTESETLTDTANTARIILTSVKFNVGSSTPSEYDAEEIERLATRLADNESETLYIVGHSDQSGSLQSNINITRARAEAVRRILIDEYGVASSRILADGVGFLAPIADNATEEGREANRRVEAVFLVN